MTVEQTTVKTERGQFTARTAGEQNKPLVVCLHGFPDNAETFDGLLEKLATNGFHVVAPFCRGYAPSPLANPDGSRFGKDLFDVLARDALAIADTFAPNEKASIVGHDNGAFTVYYLLALAPERFARAVTLTAGHPAAVFKNTARSARQMWLSRYAFFFQIPSVSDWYVSKNNFAYLEKLWNDWSAPGWTPPVEHLESVKKTLAASFPAPLLHYRSGGFSAGADWQLIKTPLLYLAGAEDGCVLPETADGQEQFFAGEFCSEIIPNAGHFLHLERADAVNQKIIEWLKKE